MGKKSRHENQVLDGLLVFNVSSVHLPHGRIWWYLPADASSSLGGAGIG